MTEAALTSPERERGGRRAPRSRSGLGLGDRTDTMHHPKLEALVRRDPRYAYEAYEFVFHALRHAPGKISAWLPAVMRQ